MSDKTGDYVCRPARKEDYMAVVNIDNNIYDGLDYVEDRFLRYISCLDHYPFVMEKNGEIVAFIYKYVIDDGTAVVGGAGRAKAELRGGRIVAGKLGSFAQNEIARLRPKAAQTRLYTAFESPIQEKHIKMGTAKLLVRRALKHYVTTMDSVRRRIRAFRYKMLSRKYAVDHVITPGKEDLVKLLLASLELFPEDRFISFWEPYRPIASNFAYVADTSVAQVTLSEDGKSAIAASFIVHHLCNAGMRFDLEFYGSSIHLLFQHLLKSLLYLSQLDYEGDIQYVMYFPADLNATEIETVINKDFDWKKGKWSRYQNYLALEVVPPKDAKL